MSSSVGGVQNTRAAWRLEAEREDVRLGDVGRSAVPRSQSMAASVDAMRTLGGNDPRVIEFPCGDRRGGAQGERGGVHGLSAGGNSRCEPLHGLSAVGGHRCSVLGLR